MDTRILKLAKLLVEYSCEVKPGENVLVSYEGESTRPLVKQIIKERFSLGEEGFSSFEKCLATEVKEWWARLTVPAIVADHSACQPLWHRSLDAFASTGRVVMVVLLVAKSKDWRSVHDCRFLSERDVHIVDTIQSGGTRNGHIADRLP